LNQVSSVTLSNCQANYGGAFYVEAAKKKLKFSDIIFNSVVAT